MKALVTGANSLVGANLVRQLVKEGYQVRAFVRPTSDIRSLDGLNIEIVTGDVLDADSLINAARGCRFLFHTAAVFSYFGYSPEAILKVATEGTANAVKAAKKAKIKRMILTSSSVVIGASDQPVVLNEYKTNPETGAGGYISSKINQETVGFQQAKELGVDIVTVCPTLCVGPHDYRLSESNAIILNYLNDPFRSTWPGGCNIVSVEDVAHGHILGAMKGRSGERYILGSENLLWKDVHGMISEICGQQGPLLTASHTSVFLTGVAQEIISGFTHRRPLVTRTQAKMVGRYYWYSSERAAELGYKPMPSRQALVKAISWLVASQHVPPSLRNTITLSREIYEEREKNS
jgi:dihydroflavonol-4-reductase